MEREDTETVAEFLRRRMVTRATTLLLAEMGVHKPCQRHKSHQTLGSKTLSQIDIQIMRKIKKKLSKTDQAARS